MLKCKCFGSVISLAMLALIGGALLGSDKVQPPSAETVTKLIARLSSADFRVRQEASEELQKLGAPVLPALRKAATGNVELETKRRIEHVVSQIETGLLKVEEKHWQALDAPKRGIKDRIVKVAASTPTMTEEQLTSAIYLLTVARRPTEEEVKLAKQQLAGTSGRKVNTLQLTRSLVQGKEYKAEVAAANGLLSKVRNQAAVDESLAQRLARLNGPGIQKTIDDVAASLDKAVKADEQFGELAFLIAYSRFPDANQAKQVAAHLKKGQNRPTATADIIWALINTKEFLMGP